MLCVTVIDGFVAVIDALGTVELAAISLFEIEPSSPPAQAPATNMLAARVRARVEVWTKRMPQAPGDRGEAVFTRDTNASRVNMLDAVAPRGKVQCTPHIVQRGGFAVCERVSCGITQCAEARARCGTSSKNGALKGTLHTTDRTKTWPARRSLAPTTHAGTQRRTSRCRPMACLLSAATRVPRLRSPSRRARTRFGRGQWVMAEGRSRPRVASANRPPVSSNIAQAHRSPSTLTTEHRRLSAVEAHPRQRRLHKPPNFIRPEHLVRGH